MKNIDFSLNVVKNFILHFASILTFESVQAGFCTGFTI